MPMSKKERLVAAIENGTVIDHIPADKTFQVATLLKLNELNCRFYINILHQKVCCGKE